MTTMSIEDSMDMCAYLARHEAPSHNQSKRTTSCFFVSLLKDSAQEQLLNAKLSLPQTSRPCTMPTSSTCMQQGTNMERRRQSSILTDDLQHQVLYLQLESKAIRDLREAKLPGRMRDRQSNIRHTQPQ